MAKIIVAGDYMTDVWWVAQRTGTSQDSGCPRYGIYNAYEYPGGAGNVAHNLEVLGNEVLRVGIGSLIRKHRLVDDVTGAQIIRWDECDYALPIYAWPRVGFDDAIVLSDYAKGALTDGLIDYICNETDAPLFIDSKRGPSQYSNFNPERLIFFPNISEYTDRRKEYDKCYMVVVKMGPLGVMVVKYGEKICESPAQMIGPGSLCGAGDVVIAAVTHRYMNTSDTLDRGQSTILDYAMKVVGEAIHASKYTCQIPKKAVS